MSVTTYTPWPVEYVRDVTGVDDTRLNAATMAAQGFLWALTGRRFGVATTVGELFRAPKVAESAKWTPYLGRDGQWRNAIMGGDTAKLELRRQPVRSVTEVRVAGGAISTWTREGSIVVVHSGAPTWDDITEGAPLAVDYEWGVDPPSQAAYALGELACEFLAGMDGEPTRLSARAISYARAGVQYEVFESRDLIDLGLTGLPLADAFVRSTNPHRLTQRSRVVSPDRHRVVG